ncbi:Multidrug resistance protein MdtA [Candidatus Entotheonellaceae bacterium PAL068K]
MDKDIVRGRGCSRVVMDVVEPGGHSRIAGWLGSLVLTALLVQVQPLWAQGGRPAVVEVAAVERQSIAQPVTFVGTVEPRRSSRVATEVEGLVSELLVDEGRRVDRGEPLVRIRQERLQILLRNRRAAAERFHQEWVELKNGTRPEVIAEARADIVEAEAELRRAQRENQRQVDLDRSGVTARRTREDAETATEIARQRLARAKARYEVALRGPRAERLAQAEAQYQVARTEVARLRYDQEQSTIRTPFAGFVVTTHTEVGQWLDRGDPVVTLIDLERAHINVPVPERYVSDVQPGAAAMVHLDALPDETWQGTVLRVIPHADEARTFPVTVEVANGKSRIKSGFVARVTLTIGAQHDALLVPKDAIVSQGPGQIVFAVRDGKAKSVPIQRSMFHEGFAVVSGDLQPGESVVVRGNERLRTGQAVRLEPAQNR